MNNDLENECQKAEESLQSILASAGERDAGAVWAELHALRNRLSDITDRAIDTEKNGVVATIDNLDREVAKALEEAQSRIVVPRAEKKLPKQNPKVRKNIHVMQPTTGKELRELLYQQRL